MTEILANTLQIPFKQQHPFTENISLNTSYLQPSLSTREIQFIDDMNYLQTHYKRLDTLLFLYDDFGYLQEKAKDLRMFLDRNNARAEKTDDLQNYVIPYEYRATCQELHQLRLRLQTMEESSHPKE
jgi:hypothetical protein